MNDDVASASGGAKRIFQPEAVGGTKVEAYLGGLRRASEVKSFVEILMKIRARASGEIGQVLPCFPDQGNALSCLFG
jgi:hypothetical protein